MPFIYGQISISSDWYSRDAHVARMQGSVLDPRRDRCNFCFRAPLAGKCERSDPRVDFYSKPSRILIVYRLNR